MSARFQMNKEGKIKLLMIVLFSIIFGMLLRPTVSQYPSFLGLPELPIQVNLACIGVAFSASLASVMVAVTKGRIARFRFDRFFLAAVLLSVLILLFSLVNPSDGTVRALNGSSVWGTVFEAWIVDWIPVLTTILLVCAFCRDYTSELVWGMFIAAGLYLVLNLVTVPWGDVGFAVAEDLFFGYRNVTFRVAIPACVCSLVIAYMHDGKWILLPIGTYCVCMFQVWVAYSATSFAALLVMGILSASIFWERSRKYLNALSYGIVYVIAFCSIVIFRAQEKLGFVIETLLHKNVSLTGRTHIWDNVISQLQGKDFFIGRGMEYVHQAIVVNGQVFTHAHNDILNILMLGGVFALACFVALCCMSIKALYERRSSVFSAAFALGLMGYLIIGLTEVTIAPGLFFILAGSRYIVPELTEEKVEIERVSSLKPE